MEKYFQLHGKTAEGRPLIHLVEPGTRYGLGASAGLEKVAGGEHLPEVLELIESIQPQSDRLYLVNSALGAGEYVGFNLRGDWFGERGLLHTPPGWDRIPVWDVDARRRAASSTERAGDWGMLAWGYPTFMNAHRFRHHVNKDPEKAYGYVLGAFWDARMHRVVLVSELVREMCARLGAVDLYDRIAGGEFPDTSMGAKVPYDRCSICNHYARSPADYCLHVRQGASPPYGMRAILGDGRMCGVYNDYPRFFDDSYVFIGAERSAKVMANITSQLKGTRAYTNQLFQPGASLSTREVTADAPASPLEERNERLGLAVAGVLNSRVRGPNESRVSEAISQALSAVPVSKNDAEAKAMQHAEELLRRRAAVSDHTVSEDELRFWEGKASRDLSDRHSVTTAQRDRAVAILRSRMDQMGSTEKLGTLAKWATMTKRLPAPDSTQYALLRDHVGRLTPVLPQRVYDECSSSVPGMWRGLSGLSALGIVLRPEEFQQCALRGMGEDALSDHCTLEGLRFQPTPRDPYHEPRWIPHIPATGDLQRLVQLLGSVLQGRSFAPSAVHVRILTPPPLVGPRSERVVDEPVLNQVSQMYNDYRMGLLARDADWSYVPLGARSGAFSLDSKTAAAADAVSALLLHLAHW
jgi:hypothetical protein